MDKIARVWDAATGRIKVCLRIFISVSNNNKTNLNGPERAIMCVGFSWNNDYVLAASNDNSVRVWNLNVERLHHNLMGHSSKVYSAKFSCDSTKVSELNLISFYLLTHL